MKIILTGASGFLGKYIYNELSSNNKLTTISRSNADINADISKEIPFFDSADLVIHCAGKAHSVPKNEKEKAAFFDVNFKGTVNLLKGLEKAPNFPNSFVFISTVAVYGCDKGILITEERALKSEEAYGQSKIQAEKLVYEWCQKHQVTCTILRLPLLVGENPPGNLGAMIKGIKKGYYFNIAGGQAKKSMVLASDVAKLIPVVATIGGIYNLTDGIHPSFAELSNVIANHLGKNRSLNLPFWLASIFAMIGGLVGEKAPINKRKLFKITSDLTFDDSKARKMLGWSPNPALEGFEQIN